MLEAPGCHGAQNPHAARFRPGLVPGRGPTGRKVEITGTHTYRFEDGEIAETWQLWDVAGFLRQIGVWQSPISEVGIASSLRSSQGRAGTALAEQSLEYNGWRDDSMIVNETLKIIKQRRSIRSYREEQIKEEELQAVLEAGLYAPNAGDQAWHFTVVQDRALLDRLNLAAKAAVRQLGIEGLGELANDETFNCLYSAPTLIIVSGNEQAPIPLEADCAAATENLLIAAESIGLGSCWVFFVVLAFSSPQGPELRRELKIPEGYKPYYSAVLGYKEDAVVSVPDRKPNLITYIR